MARWDPPYVIHSQVVFACQLGLYLHSFFWKKYHFWLFLEYRKGCGHIDMLMTPLVTLILNIYRFVGLMSTKSRIHGQTDR